MATTPAKDPLDVLQAMFNEVVCARNLILMFSWLTLAVGTNGQGDQGISERWGSQRGQRRCSFAHKDARDVEDISLRIRRSGE